MTRRRMPTVIKSPADQHEGKQAEQSREQSVVAAPQPDPKPKAKKTASAPTPIAPPELVGVSSPETNPQPKEAAQSKPEPKPSSKTGTQRTVRVPIDDAVNARIKALSKSMGKPINYIETGLLKKALAGAKKRLKSGNLEETASDIKLLHTAHGDAKYRTTERKVVLTAIGEQALRGVVDDPLEVISINSLAGALIGAELKLIIKKV